MPFEKNRKRHSLKIPIPGDNQYAFYIWITDEISFVQQNGIYQEVRLGLRNGMGPTTRTLKTEDVDIGGNDTIPVETITGAKHKETQGIGQEANWSFLTDPQNHLKTHDVKVYARKKDGTTDQGRHLTIRKIDQIYVKETQGIGQEAYWTLDNRDDEDQINFSAPDAVYNKTYGALRLDWFQKVVKPDPLYMLVMYGGNKIAAVSMSDITKSTFPVAFNKTLTSSWDSYGDGTRTCQFRFGPKTHILSMNLKIAPDGVISTPLNSYQAHYYNTAISLLQYATQADPEIYTHDAFFNGTSTGFYTSLGQHYGVSETGAISFVGKQLDVAYPYPTAISETGEYYSGPTVSVGGPFIDFGGELTTSQSSTIWTNLNVYPLGRVAYSYSVGPGAGDIHTTVVGAPLDPPYSWSGGGTEICPRMIYGNDGEVDKITLKYETATYSANGFLEPTYIGPTWGAGGSNKTISFLGRSGATTFYQPSGPAFTEDIPPLPIPRPEPVFSFSGLKDAYLTGSRFALGEGLEDMWVSFDNWNGDGSLTKEEFNPYGITGGDVVEDGFVCNGKHYLSIVRYAPGDVWEQRFFLDKVEVTNKFHNLIGGSSVYIDHIIFDVKLSDIKKLK